VYIFFAIFSVEQDYLPALGARTIFFCYKLKSIFQHRFSLWVFPIFAYNILQSIEKYEFKRVRKNILVVLHNRKYEIKNRYTKLVVIIVDSWRLIVERKINQC
jgi:hypothetical protein